MLNNLIKINRKRKIIGRGGDRGGTAGKGHKGQKARTKALVSLQFEGGQTPLTRRIPKCGFNNSLFKNNYEVISLNEIASIIKKTKNTNLDQDFFEFHKNIKKNKKIKLLGPSCGNFKEDFTNVKLSVHSYSKKAYDLFEQLGGKITVIS